MSADFQLKSTTTAVHSTRGENLQANTLNSGVVSVQKQITSKRNASPRGESHSSRISIIAVATTSRPQKVKSASAGVVVG